MRRGKSLLLGILIGVIACYLAVDWRIGAAAGLRDLYAVAAIEARQELQACQSASSPWPRRRR